MGCMDALGFLASHATFCFPPHRGKAFPSMSKLRQCIVSRTWVSMASLGVSLCCSRNSLAACANAWREHPIRMADSRSGPPYLWRRRSITLTLTVRTCVVDPAWKPSEVTSEVTNTRGTQSRLAVGMLGIAKVRDMWLMLNPCSCLHLRWPPPRQPRHGGLPPLGFGHLDRDAMCLISGVCLGRKARWGCPLLPALLPRTPMRKAP